MKMPPLAVAGKDRKTMKKNPELDKMLRLGLVNIAWSIPIYIIVLVFHPSLLWFVALLNAAVIIRMLYDVRIAKKASFKPLQAGKMLLQVSAFGTAIYYLGLFFGGYGLAGYVVFVLLITMWIIWQRRRIYLQALRTIEARIWGKPLERGLWKGQKPIVPKIKRGGDSASNDKQA